MVNYFVRVMVQVETPIRTRFGDVWTGREIKIPTLFREARKKGGATVRG
jgi:hypothetical protein